MTEKNVLQMVRSVLLAPYKPASSMLWLSGDVKELTHISQSVGNEVPDVVVWPLVVTQSVGVGNAGDFSYDKATLQSEGK